MRKPIQIAVTTTPAWGGSDVIYALCDDGSLWLMTFEGPPEDCAWERLRDIPQPSTEVMRDMPGSSVGAAHASVASGEAEGVFSPQAAAALAAAIMRRAFRP